MEAVPLTYAQKFIFRVQTQLGPFAPLLQLSSCVRVKGVIDTDRFERAASELVARYPVLCSRLDISTGEPMQRQVAAAPFFEIVDISGYTDHQADIMLSARADEPFDLFQENPFKIVLACVGPSDAILMLLVHHLFCDETAKEMLLGEYLALALGGSKSITDARRESDGNSFLALAIKEQNMISNGTFSRRIQHWVRYLDGVDPALRLPGRQAEDPAVSSLASMKFGLGRDRFQVFADRAHRLGVSQFALVANAIFHALREATAQDNILITVVSDTRRPPFDRTIGQFAGTFPIGQYSRDGGLGDNAARLIFRQIVKAVGNYVPNFCYENEIGWLKERHAKGYSMADVSVNYVPRAADFKAAARDDGQVSLFPLTARARREDIPYHGMAIKFSFQPDKGTLGGLLEYDSVVVGHRTAEMMASSLLKALTVP